MSKAVISGLTDKLAENLGLVDHYQAQLAVLEEQKGHLVASLTLFNPTFDLAKVKPRRYVEKQVKVEQAAPARAEPVAPATDSEPS